MLSREFYMQDANTVARGLLGKLLVHRSPEGTAAGMIVEVEAYRGRCDKGAHSYPMKRTERTEIQFGPGGFAYIFSIYGMHCCFNVTANAEGEPDAVLVRALEPVKGMELMSRRRGRGDIRELCGGPGKLCRALGITKELYGADLREKELFIEDFREIPDREVMVSPRVNIDYAQECRDWLWRYYIKNDPYVSRVPAKYRGELYVK